MPDLLAALFRRRWWPELPPASVAGRKVGRPRAAGAATSRESLRARTGEDPASHSASATRVGGVAAVIDTPRLALRELTVEDAPFVLQLLNDPSFLRYIGDRGVRNLDEAQRYIVKGMVQSYERHGFGLWLVELREDDHRPIGLCGLVSREGLPAPDIGFALLPQWWSQGFALEAASAVMAHARRVVGLSRVLAIASPQNESSVRLLRRLGFRFDSEIRMPGEAQPVGLFVCEPPA
jgi:[ribosomal protein S5]-alanine N-acetyltransferase